MQTQRHKPDSIVVDPVQGTEMRMLQSMGELRIGFARSMGLLEVHGVDRIESVIQHTKTLKRHNPAGYAIQALTDDWAIISASQQDDYSRDPTSPANMRRLANIDYIY